MAFAVIGHSFVRRLQDHPLFKIESADLHVVGISGSTVDRLSRSAEYQHVIMYKPDTVFQ